MPLEKKTIEVSQEATVCPECGDHKVTPMDNPEMPTPRELIIEGPSGRYEYTNVCWGCGWAETVTVEIEHSEE